MRFMKSDVEGNKVFCLEMQIQDLKNIFKILASFFRLIQQNVWGISFQLGSQFFTL